LLAEPGALRVLKAYLRTNSRVRLVIAKLVESIADQKPAGPKSITKASMTKTSVARRDTTVRGEPRTSRAQT
jgi:hypothetical protein